MAFGTGSAIGRRAVDAVMGGGSAAPEPVARENFPVERAPADLGACAVDHRAFLQCMQESKGNASSCEMYYTALQNCQAGKN